MSDQLSEPASELTPDAGTPAADDEPPAPAGASPLRLAGLLLGWLLRRAWAVVRGGWSAVRGVARFVWRWRRPLVIVPLMAGIVVAGAVGTRMLIAPKAPVASQAPIVVCWNGKQLPRTSCGRPVGVDGLQWVFPAFRPHAGHCAAVPHRNPDGAPAPTVWTCTAFVQGLPVTITYAARVSLGQGLAQVRSDFAGTRARPVRGGERLLFSNREPDGDGRYSLLEAYAKYPYTVMVTGPTAELRDDALARYVKFRKAASVVVQPVEPSSSF